jgi:hypothetical protein
MGALFSHGRGRGFEPNKHAGSGSSDAARKRRQRRLEDARDSPVSTYLALSCRRLGIRTPVPALELAKATGEWPLAVPRRAEALKTNVATAL